MQTANKARPVDTLSVQQVHSILRDDSSAIYLDIRIRSDFEKGHVPDSVNIPAFVRTEEGEMQEVKEGFLKQLTKKLPDKSVRYFVGCTSGVLSVDASRWMLDSGYKSVVNVAGGFSAWASDYLPTTEVRRRDCREQTSHCNIPAPA